MSTTIQKKNGKQQMSTPQPQQETAWYTPLVDIVETHDAFLFQADLPGVKADDVDVSYDDGTLTLSARVQPRQPEQTSYLWREYGVGSFHRSFSLSTPIDADGIRAQLRNGVLELYVPKAERAKTRKIQVQSA
jgi:HSP20 family molecular chaperone IbpA